MEFKVYTKRKSNIKAQLDQSMGKSIVMDSAADFYARLVEACADGMDIDVRYAIVRSVFRRVVEQSIIDCRIAFVGFFAKLDYCLKENSVPQNIAALLQQARRDLFPNHDSHDKLTAETAEVMFPHNLKAAALLVYHLCGKEPIPQQLKDHFPIGDRKHTWGAFSERMLRVVVERWDDSYIWATEEENNSTIKISYGKDNRYLTREGTASWQYLGQLLWVGAQLSLVRVRRDERGEVVLPELIILEPDYLVNVTTIASCFETYAESPFVSLINRLKPQPQSISILLGNLAGLLLDQTVHDRNAPFEQTFEEFTHRNVLSLLACPDITGPEGRKHFEQFKHDAQVQQRNIRKLIGEDLPHIVGHYDPKAVTLEPSFFSEVLGIQGRLDFLYADGDDRIIIEQKSGKGDFVPFSSPDYSPDVPAPKEPHLVQTILYRAVLQYEFNMYANQLQHIMLLYSKYAKGLLMVPQSPDLLLRAIRMRNLIAWTEIMYAKEGMDIITTLTPEKLNMKHSAGLLWEVYTRPELERVLSPVTNASPLERAYYLRFMKFIANEQLLAKMGNKMKEDSGFAAIWHETLEDKHAAGNIYDQLTISAFASADGTEIAEDKELGKEEAVGMVTLTFGDKSLADTTNFRTGDIVILYPYNEGNAPDACAQMVIRAAIADIREDSLVLRLRNSQTDRRVFAQGERCLWAVEHDLYESSTGGLYSGMHSFLSASQRRRDLILSQRQPDVDPTLEIRGSYGNFDTLVRRAKQARDLFLIIGPPGTGKTSYGLVNLLTEEMLEEDTSILLLSYTNRAVDEICSKLLQLQRQDPKYDFLRIGSDLSCAPEYRDHLLSNRTANSGGNETMRLLLSIRIFCGTTAALSANMSLFSIKRFELAIVDEASQILEPHLIGLLSAQHGGEEAIGRVVLVGDHKQLPAVVQQTPDESEVTDPLLLGIGLSDCRRSLFERLLQQCRKADGSYDERYVYMLTRQGRMHRDIASFPSKAFYEGRLDVVPLQHQLLPSRKIETDNGIRRLLTAHRIAFVATRKPQAMMTREGGNVGMSAFSVKTNPVEARMIAATVYEIYRMVGDDFDTVQTVGVIVPYRNQISTVRNAIDHYGITKLHDITIDTVERYQGSQRDYILYGFTIQQPYQLNFLTSNVFEENGEIIDRKLNVAMTRARLGLVIFGNEPLLRENVTFSRLMDFVLDEGGWVDVDEADWCEGHF